jgi:hypothetical protein
VDIAATQRAAFRIAELIEYEERARALRLEVPVPDRPLLITATFPANRV